MLHNIFLLLYAALLLFTPFLFLLSRRYPYFFDWDYARYSNSKNRKYLDRNEYIDIYAFVINTILFMILSPYHNKFFIAHIPSIDISIFGICLVTSILFVIKINNISKIKIYEHEYELYANRIRLIRKELFIISAIHYFLCISLLACIFINIKNENTIFPPQDKVISSATQSEISKVVKELPKGVFFSSCPKEMTVGILEKCKARIANEEFLSKFGLQLKEIIGKEKDISLINLAYVSPLMNVKLISEQYLSFKAFDIPQEDGGDRIVIDQKSADWNWDVTPNESGIKKIKFKVFLIVKISNYKPLSPIPFEEIETEIDVKVNPIFSVNLFIRENWKYLLMIFVIISISIVFGYKFKLIYGNVTNIEVGSIGNIQADNNNGQIDILKVSGQISNSIEKDRIVSIQSLVLHDKVISLLEKLRQLIKHNPSLEKKPQKQEYAFTQIKKLIDICNANESNVNMSVYIDNLRQIIAGEPSLGDGFSIINEIFNLLSNTK